MDIYPHLFRREGRGLAVRLQPFQSQLVVGSCLKEVAVYVRREGEACQAQETAGPMKSQVSASMSEAAFMRKGPLELILEVQSWRSWQDNSS